MGLCCLTGIYISSFFSQLKALCDLQPCSLEERDATLGTVTNINTRQALKKLSAHPSISVHDCVDGHSEVNLLQ